MEIWFVNLGRRSGRGVKRVAVVDKDQRDSIENQLRSNFPWLAFQDFETGKYLFYPTDDISELNLEIPKAHP